MTIRHSKLIVGNSLRVLGAVPQRYKNVVRKSLLAEHPTAKNVTVTAEERPADEYSREPYTLLTASGEVQDE